MTEAMSTERLRRIQDQYERYRPERAQYHAHSPVAIILDLLAEVERLRAAPNGSGRGPGR